MLLSMRSHYFNDNSHYFFATTKNNNIGDLGAVVRSTFRVKMQCENAKRLNPKA